MSTIADVRPAPAALSDEDVVLRVLAGEPALFEVLMRRYNQRLYRAVRGILRDDTEAEDVMQQAYVNAFAHLAQFQGRARFSTWLTRIATYEALARLRRRRRAKEDDDMFDGADRFDRLSAPDADPERQAFAAELRRVLEAALDTLPAGLRSVFILREVEELSTAETAECLGVSEDVAKTRLHRARALLRDELWQRARIARGDVFAFPAVRCDRVVAAVFRALDLTRIN